MGTQLAVSLQDLRRLEVACLEALPAEGVSDLQDFDRITQVLEQLAQCCERLSLENSLKDVQIGRSIVERLVLGDVRERLLAQASRSCIEPGDIELF
ncbi:hypothetical protein HKD24_04950 [Gluconobacter sp. LMG 31484]|uniref:Uncharacterized protein n=1 Tax=Gluconobacter vitians TaxID=2728102 RepID=A0ABR9Y3Z4_9PROT|nr:hypothetical protein [Gluconobacter vitians]MBF0858567.1 hypothetical protein [Gluconobacter vitians]